MYVNEDVRLWQDAFLKEDIDALSALYHTYYSDLFQYGYKLVPHTPTVEDCLQDLFLYLWEKRSSLSVPQSIKFYLLKSFRRRLLRIQQRDKNIYYLSQVPEDSMTFTPADIAVRKNPSGISKHALIQFLNQLPPRQKEIIYLKYFEGLTNDEIAEVLSLGYQVVANNLYRAFITLRQKAPQLKPLIMDS